MQSINDLLKEIEELISIQQEIKDDLIVIKERCEEASRQLAELTELLNVAD